MNRSTEVLTQRNVESASPPEAVVSKPSKQMVLVGWDKQRTYTFIALSVCFVVWACVFFPLLLKSQNGGDDKGMTDMPDMPDM